ncbi:MAG: amidohydrolase family protein [bacterium]
MLASLAATAYVATVLLKGGTVIDGLGHIGKKQDVRIQGDRIVAVGRLRSKHGETVIDAKGLIVCPGFIDAHSHADGGIDKEPTAISQVTQGVTTAVVGQDGIWSKPVSERLVDLEGYKPAINFAMFSGAGGIRGEVMGKDYERAAKPEEVAKMEALVEADMKAGAIGVSTGLEYDPGHYSTTEELVSLAKVAAKYHGMYISHVRDEGNGALDSFKELIRIAKEGGLPA